jgi:hypothetical protein
MDENETRLVLEMVVAQVSATIKADCELSSYEPFGEKYVAYFNVGMRHGSWEWAYLTNGGWKIPVRGMKCFVCLPDIPQGLEEKPLAFLVKDIVHKFFRVNPEYQKAIGA